MTWQAKGHAIPVAVAASPCPRPLVDKAKDIIDHFEDKHHHSTAVSVVTGYCQLRGPVAKRWKMIDGMKKQRACFGEIPPPLDVRGDVVSSQLTAQTLLVSRIVGVLALA